MSPEDPTFNSESDRLAEREKQWQKKLEELDELADGAGLGLDEKIIEPVAGLDLLGFNTRASCEGHVDQTSGKATP